MAAHCRLRSRADAEFLKNVLDVNLGRRWADEETACDLAVRKALLDKPQDISLARREAFLS
jgi:hypothetical protein